MLPIKKTVMLVVAGDALGFFMGSGHVIPFSFDLSDFCRSFRVESDTTIKIYVAHDDLLVNETMKCKMSSKEAVFLTFGPQIDIRSSSGRKIEGVASFVGS